MNVGLCCVLGSSLGYVLIYNMNNTHTHAKQHFYEIPYFEA